MVADRDATQYGYDECVRCFTYLEVTLFSVHPTRHTGNGETQLTVYGVQFFVPPQQLRQVDNVGDVGT